MVSFGEVNRSVRSGNDTQEATIKRGFSRNLSLFFFPNEKSKDKTICIFKSVESGDI
jgi:hypothetical protein